MAQEPTEGQSIRLWDCLCCSPLCCRSRLLDCYCCSLLGCCHIRFWDCCCGPNRLCCEDPRSEDVYMSSGSGEHHATGQGASSAKGVSTKTKMSEKQQSSSVTTLPAQKTRRYGTGQPATEPNPTSPTAEVVTVQAGGELHYS